MSETEFTGVHPQEIKPEALGINLAKQEMHEEQKNAFEQELLKQIASAYLSELKTKRQMFEFDTFHELKRNDKVSTDAEIKMLAEQIINTLIKQNRLPDLNSIRATLAKVKKLKPVFTYSDVNTVEGFQLDMLYASPPEFEPETQADPEIKGLPRRNQKFITDVDLATKPTAENTIVADKVDLNTLFRQVSAKDPEGAKYFLEEIFDREEIALLKREEELKETEKSIVALLKNLTDKPELAYRVSVNLEEVKTEILKCKKRLESFGRYRKTYKLEV